MSFDCKTCINSAKISSDIPIVFDVGCNINKIVELNNAEWIENWNDDFTILFLEQYPNSKCYAVEPLHWQEFENKWKDDKRVELLKIGLSDRDCSEVIYYPGQRHVLSSFYLQDDFSNEFIHSEKIQCKKLDTLVSDLNIDKIDYLKIDTEGAELKIIMGAERLLEQKRIQHIQFEYGLTDPNIPSVDCIIEYLKQFDYHEVLTSGREKLWSCSNV